MSFVRLTGAAGKVVYVDGSKVSCLEALESNSLLTCIHFFGCSVAVVEDIDDVLKKILESRNVMYVNGKPVLTENVNEPNRVY